MKTKFLSWLLPDPFDCEWENTCHKDGSGQILKQIKLTMLMVSTIGFLFVVWDLWNLDTELQRWLVIFPMTVTWIGLWLYLEKWPGQAKPWLCYLSIFAMAIASADLLTLLAMLGKAEYYLRVYPAIMVIFAYVYGPFAIPVKLGMSFGLLITMTMLALGGALGVPAKVLGSSVFFLISINFAGAYTQCQLKAYSQRSLLAQQMARLERMEADSARQMAEQSGQEITQFLRNSSHNLRQPLQALNSYSTLLETALGSGDPHLISQIATKLIASVDSLSMSFDRLLDISRLAAEQQDAGLAAVSLDRILDGIADQYAPAAAKKGIRLKVAVGGRTPLLVRSDEVMLRQVVGNLVDNAIKYTQKGWILVKARPLRGGVVRLDIIDTGVGIADGDQRHIFEEFYRVPTHSREYGFGIGLAYVEKAVAKLHGHRLGFTSRKGAGTRFHIEIPQAEAGLRPVGREPPAAINIAGIFVMLVDDDNDVLHAVGEQLLGWGCEVEKARCLTDARNALDDNLNTPDLLITDLWLRGGETAEDIVRCFEEFCGEKPVIVITGDTDASDTLARFSRRPVLLKKPFSDALLLQAIAAALTQAGGLAFTPLACQDSPPPASPAQSPAGTPRQSARSAS